MGGTPIHRAATHLLTEESVEAAARQAGNSRKAADLQRGRKMLPDVAQDRLHTPQPTKAVLRDAQAHPERYPNLSVRVSGWSARFASLNREWQELIISRMEAKEK